MVEERIRLIITSKIGLRPKVGGSPFGSKLGGWDGWTDIDVGGLSESSPT
jgi:hypothetical protein